MTFRRWRPAMADMVIFGLTILVGGSFAFAALQGDYGLIRRIQIQAEKEALIAERDRLTIEVARMENLARRLSDSYLDLDLLDEQARSVLGLMRSDEIAIR